MRDVGGFRMGPFELMELTGLDVTQPASELIYQQFFQEPRYRPNLIMRSRYEAGVLGRKSEAGLLRLRRRDEADRARPKPAPPAARPASVWVSPAEPQGHAALAELLQKLGAAPESGAKPGPKALCLVTPIGEDATTCAVEQGLDPARTVAVDTLFPMVKRRTIMGTPLTDPAYRDAAHGLLASDGVPVTVCRDSPGFIAQRIVVHDREHRLLDRAEPHRAARRHRQGGDAGPQLSERPVQVRRRARARSAYTRCSPRCIVSTAIRATGPISGSRGAPSWVFPC